MTSLRARLVWLCVLVAGLSTGLGLFAAHQALARAIAATEAAAGDEVAAAVQVHLIQAQQDLAATVGDYAVWDEMYDNMPDPDPAWAAANMAPSSGAGRLLSALVTEHAPDRFTRWRNGATSGMEPSSGDPATAQAITVLLRSLPGEISGIANLEGAPALFAVARVRRTDGSGPARGRLLALAYLDEARLKRLGLPGWRLAWDARAEGRALNLIGADSTVRLSLHREAGPAKVDRVLLALLAGGVASVALAVVLGTLLGWLWLDPLRLIARTAAARARDPAVHLPDPGTVTLDEAREVATGLQALDAAAAAIQRELQLALSRAHTANQIHRRFLAQLGHEFGAPLRRIIAAAAAQAEGRLDAEEAAAVRTAGLDLEARLQDVLGLIGPAEGSSAMAMDLRAYASGVLDLVRSRARSAATALVLEVPALSARQDAALLTPVLVNVLVNAIAAAPGGTVSLAATIAAKDVLWTVRDDGRGLDPQQQVALTAALREGGVAAGDERIGLGLALCLANLRVLGGRLALTSAGPGCGTTVTIRVPGSHEPGDPAPIARTPGR
jgi:signal transduction histidine kinase